MFDEHPVFRRYDAIRLGKEMSPLLVSASILLEVRGGTILVPGRKQAIQTSRFGSESPEM